MIGSTYRSKAAQAIVGPAHSPLIPDVLWVGWLDGTGALLGMSGESVLHSAFGPVTNGVTNTTALDCGVAGAGWVIAAVGLFDAAAGELLITAERGTPLTPATGAPLVIGAGGVVFTVA